MYFPCIGSCIFNIQKIRIHNSHVLRNQPNNFDAEIPCVVLFFHRPCAHLDTTLEVERGIHRVPEWCVSVKREGVIMVVMWRLTDGVNAVKHTLHKS